MQFSLLFEESVERDIPFAVKPERYQRLAEELGRYVGSQVTIRSGKLRDAPSDGYVLFAGTTDISQSLIDCGPTVAKTLAPRLVLLDVSWQKALEKLEKHRLAGVVDSLRLAEWSASPSSNAGPFGLRYLAKSLGVSCVSMPAFHSTHYCLLQSLHHRGLPHLLADYLAAYDADQRPLSEVPRVTLSRMRQGLNKRLGKRVQTEASPDREIGQNSQTESVGIKRAIEALKLVRKSAQISLPQITDNVGLSAEKLGMLEEGDYPHLTLGDFRAYSLALESVWGWRLAGIGQSILHSVDLPTEQAAILAGGLSNLSPEAGYQEVAIQDVYTANRFGRPREISEIGVTVTRKRPSRRGSSHGELDSPTVLMKEELYESV